MNKSFDINAYFASVLRKDAEALRLFFLEDAVIRWHNTNEAFTVDEFIRANCEYPGRWTGEIERVLRGNDESPNGTAVESAAEKIVLAASVVSEDEPSARFHCCSFLALRGGLIASLDEYWGDDGEPPGWRRALGLGRPIRQ